MTTHNAPPKSERASRPARPPSLNDPQALTKCHLRFGWWTLLVFLTLGLILESLHGFKVGMYLKVSSETRRLMWTLAHAHGTLLGVGNLGFAFTVRLLPDWAARKRAIASICLRGSTWLMPAGFFLGGMFIYSGDPGLGILLVPAGGLLLLSAVFLTACAAGHFRIDLQEPDRGSATSLKRR